MYRLVLLQVRYLSTKMVLSGGVQIDLLTPSLPTKERLRPGLKHPMRLTSKQRAHLLYRGRQADIPLTQSPHEDVNAVLFRLLHCPDGLCGLLRIHRHSHPPLCGLVKIVLLQTFDVRDLGGLLGLGLGDHDGSAEGRLDGWNADCRRMSLGGKVGAGG